LDLLAAAVRAIDRLNDAIGRAVSWICLAMVLTTGAVVLLRYIFAVGFVWMQESYVWMHAVVFMVGAGYTLLHDGHVRVDVFYRPAGRRYRAWVDLVGSLVLLLPMAAVVAYMSMDYVGDSWVRLETSREAGGLPGLFLLKTIIPAFCVLVGLQGLALAGRSFLVLRDYPIEDAVSPPRAPLESDGER
jgi:TRAP-type mannitol/chloroaromatic compound transport system permease small subunit